MPKFWKKIVILCFRVAEWTRETFKVTVWQLCFGRLVAALRVPINGRGHLPFLGDNTQKRNLQGVYSQPYNGTRLKFVQEVKAAGGDGAKFWRHKTKPDGTARGAEGADAFSLCKGCTPTRANTSAGQTLWLSLMSHSDSREDKEYSSNSLIHF